LSFAGIAALGHVSSLFCSNVESDILVIVIMMFIIYGCFPVGTIRLSDSVEHLCCMHSC